MLIAPVLMSPPPPPPLFVPLVSSSLSLPQAIFSPSSIAVFFGLVMLLEGRLEQLPGKLKKVNGWPRCKCECECGKGYGSRGGVRMGTSIMCMCMSRIIDV